MKANAVQSYRKVAKAVAREILIQRKRIASLRREVMQARNRTTRVIVRGEIKRCFREIRWLTQNIRVLQAAFAR